MTVGSMTWSFAVELNLTYSVGIRKLEQNASEIITSAAIGVRSEVLSNGKPVGVVIQRRAPVGS